MKYFKLFPAFVALACVFHSCTDEKPQAAPAIECQTSLDVPAEGGNITFPVTVHNPVSSISLKASSQSEWLLSLEVSDGYVGFTAPANQTGELRSAEIRLSYEGAEDVVVSVSQDAETVPAMFAFEALEIGSVKAKIKITPVDLESQYLSLAMSESDFNMFETEEDVVDHVVSYFSSFGDLPLLVGESQMNAANLSPETSYFALAFGYDGSRATTGVNTFPFTTLAPPSVDDVRFDIEIREVTGNSVTANFTPDPVYYRYAVAAVPAEESESFGSDISKWDEYIKGVADGFIQSGAISSYEEYAVNACRRDEFYVKIENLEYSTDYYAAAILVDEHLDVIALPFLSEKFRTLDKPSEDPLIVLESSEYFDGTELAEKYPEFASFAGKAVVPVTGRFENSSCWYAGSMDRSQYDLFLSANYLEIALVDMSMCIEKISHDDYPDSPFVHFFAIDWGKDVMITSIAYNDATKASKSGFSSVPVKPEQGSAADISEFEKYM